jgi:gluconokinase
MKASMRLSLCHHLGSGFDRAQRSAMTRLLIMGVAGAGKSTLGQALAQGLGWRFLDADDFHTQASKDKIARGIALGEDDRAGWLSAIKSDFSDESVSTILACSALKAAHRKTLKPDYLVFLKADVEVVRVRLIQRRGHFAGPSLVPSQFSTLEEPSEGMQLDASLPTVEQVRAIIDHFGLLPS